MPISSKQQSATQTKITRRKTTPFIAIKKKAHLPKIKRRVENHHLNWNLTRRKKQSKTRKILRNYWIDWDSRLPQEELTKIMSLRWLSITLWKIVLKLWITTPTSKSTISPMIRITRSGLRLMNPMLLQFMCHSSLSWSLL